MGVKFPSVRVSVRPQKVSSISMKLGIQVVLDERWKKVMTMPGSKVKFKVRSHKSQQQLRYEWNFTENVSVLALNTRSKWNFDSWWNNWQKCGGHNYGVYFVHNTANGYVRFATSATPLSTVLMALLSKMAAAILDFLHFRFVMVRTVKRFELRHRAKCRNCWNCSRDMAILDFWNYKFLTVGRVRSVELRHHAKFRGSRLTVAGYSATE